jgi:hypothetical protein
MSEFPQGLPQGLPRLPETSAPPIPVGEGSPRQSVGQMGRRLVSLSGPAVTRQDAEAAKRTFTGVLQNILAELQELEEKPLWEGAESLSGDALSSAIQGKERKIGELEGQLKTAKENLALAGKALKGSYTERSQQVLQIEAKLNALRASLEVYKTLSTPEVTKAVDLAKKTQEACQRLSQMSRHQTAFSDSNVRAEYTKTVGELNAYKRDLSTMSTEMEAKAAKGDAVAAAALKIYNEALNLLRGTADRVKATIQEVPPPIVNPGLTLHPLRAIRDARKFFGIKKLEIADLVQTLTPVPGKVQRLTHSGRQIHAQEVHDLEESLRDLENKTTRLLDKVATGKATEADRQTIQELKGHLEAARQRYEDLSLTIGRKMASGQFIGRAVCLASITVSQNRIEAIEAAFSDAIEKISDYSTQILGSLSTALRSEGQKRAVAFYEACVTWEDLRDQVEGLATKNPLARVILEQKVKQLQDQLKSASGSVFALQSDREREEQESAIQIASGVATKDRRQAIPFLINAMTRLTVFAMSESDNPQEIKEATELRTAVDLCMRQMSPEELEAMPQELLERYQKTTGPKKGERSWNEQIGATHAAIVDFGKQLAKTKKQLSLLGNYQSVEDQQEVLEAIDQLTVCEQKLASDEASLDPEIFGATKRSFDRLKEETPIELTPKERKLIESLPRLPKPPSSEEKKTIQLTLAKLMFQARHHPSEQVRKEKEEQAERLIGAMGFNVEYRSVLADLSSHKVMQEFQSTIQLKPLDLPPGLPLGVREEKERQWVDAIFADSSLVWAQTILTADSLQILPEDREKVDAHIRFQQDLVFLRQNVPMLSKKKPSWEFAARLQGAYDRVKQASDPALRVQLDSFERELAEYTKRSSISDDKTKIARGALEGAPKGESRYFTERIVEEEDRDKKLERMNGVIVPLLREAISGEPQKNPKLVQALPKILARFIEIDPDFLTRYPETLPLLARYVAKQAGVPVPSMNPPNAFIFALLSDVASNEPPKNPELVVALPQLLRGFVLIDPDFLTRYPETLPLLAQYVAREAATDAYQSFGGRMAVPADAAQRASEVFQRFIGGVPPYEPTEEWRVQADEFLKAAAVLGNALGTSTLFVSTGSECFLKAAKAGLLSAVRSYEERKVLKNPEFVAARQELQALAAKLSPEALARNGYKDFPALYQAYKEKLNYIHGVLQDKFPSDPRLVLKIQEFPHAEFLGSYRNGLEIEVTGSSDKMVEAGKAAYFASDVGKMRLEGGKRFIENAVRTLQGLPPEQQREMLFSDTFRDGFRASLGNPPQVLFDELEASLFQPLIEEEKSQIKQLSDKLGAAQSFNPRLLQEYKDRVCRVYLLSNIRYSGKYAQSFGDYEVSALTPSLLNPLVYEGRLERLRTLSGFTPDHAMELDRFLTTTQSLAQNFTDFKLRVKDSSKKPPGYLDKEMRKATVGFLDFAVGRRRLILEVFEENKDSPAYARSFNIQVERGLAEAPEEGTVVKVREKLSQAAEKLHEYEEEVLGSLSEETRKKLRAPLANPGIVFSEDSQLTPARILEIARDGKIDEVRSLLLEAAELAKDNPALLQKIKDLYSQIGQWLSQVLKDVISSCADEEMRKALIAQEAKVQQMPKKK